jgi:hypothetical protein
MLGFNVQVPQSFWHVISTAAELAAQDFLMRMVAHLRQLLSVWPESRIAKCSNPNCQKVTRQTSWEYRSALGEFVGGACGVGGWAS